MRQVIGVDIGGTGIKGLVVNEAGMVLAEMVRATRGLVWGERTITWSVKRAFG